MRSFFILSDPIDCLDVSFKTGHWSEMEFADMTIVGATFKIALHHAEEDFMKHLDLPLASKFCNACREDPPQFERFLWAVFAS